jgi:hypothetical protein
MAPARLPGQPSSTCSFESGRELVIRVEIGTMPALLRSIVRSALETEDDFDVLAAPRATLSSDFGQADVVVVCRDREPFECIPVPLLADRRGPAIVAIDSDGDAAAILSVIAESCPVADASGLCGMVRHAALARRKATH